MFGKQYKQQAMYYVIFSLYYYFLYVRSKRYPQELALKNPSSMSL